MIVWLASYPRSGNTLLRMALYHLCGVETHSVYDDPLFVQAGMSGVVGHELLPAPVEELAADGETYFVKTHTRPVDDSPAVCVVRDGRDVMVSLAKYNLAFNPQGEGAGGEFSRLVEDIVTASGGDDHWGEHVLSWAEAGAFLVRYEDLVAAPEAWLRGISCNLDLGLRVGGTMPGFGELHARWPKFFRSGRVGEWRKEFPPDLYELFWERHGEAMRRFGYV
jgi:hypothetical protein